MNRRHWYLLALATVTYFFLSFVTPVNQATLDRFHISVAAVHFLQLTLLVPLVLIWFAAIYGYAHLKNYAGEIKKDPDGKGLNTIALGLGILAGGMIITGLIGEVISYFSATRLNLIPANVIINNYLSVILTLSSFWYVYKGSESLVKLIPKHDHHIRRRIMLAVYAVLAAIYCVLALHNPQKRVKATYAAHGTYYLPDVLIVLTVLLPYVVAWAFGILAAINLSHYRHNVKGHIYRQAIQYLGIGFSTVIGASILEQILSLFNASFQAASLNTVLMIIYVLLIIIGVGFLMIARGAKRLKQLEGL